MVGEIDPKRLSDSQNLLRTASTRLLMESCRINCDAAQPFFCERGCQRAAADVAIAHKENLCWSARGFQSTQHVPMVSQQTAFGLPVFKLSVNRTQLVGHSHSEHSAGYPQITQLK